MANPCTTRTLFALLSLLTAALFPGQAQAGQTELPFLVVSAPGPRNISYLPVDLIPKIGADRAEGVQLRILPTGGGAIAMKNLMTRNADFAVAGQPAAMSLRANGGEVVTIAAVDDAPLFVFMVRAGLRDSVRRLSDLKGKIIGVNTSSLSSKTTSQQLAELLLRSDGVAPNTVRILSAGQSWAEQSSLIRSNTVDAIMGDEPFASRLLAEGQVFFLANLADPASIKNIPGAGFLHAALQTRTEIVAKEPAKAATMVRILRRSLAWIASHSPEELVAQLEIADPEERQFLLESLKKYPRSYSKDGSFSANQLRETETFFHATSQEHPASQALRLETMIVDTWAGRRP